MAVRDAIQVLPTLKELSRTRQKARRNKILSTCPCKVTKVLSEIAKNILYGHIKVPKKSLKLLKLYKKDLRKLAKQKSSASIKRTLNQKGGFLPFLIKPALTLLATIAANRLAR